MRCVLFERFAHPALVRLTGETAVRAVDAAGEHVVVALGGLRIDVVAADANCGRAEETQPPRGLLVCDVD